jgi:D-3-phosphoglycerate dehydrogenase
MTGTQRVLITDKVSEKAVERFQAEKGLSVDFRPGLPPEEILKTIGDVSALVVRSQTKVTSEMIEAARSLRVIGRAGTGVDNVDVEAATRAGIVVMNVPGGNTLSAAEQGKFLGTELSGKTLGVLGMGRIGREVARRAKAFGMEVVAFDPFLPEEMMGKIGVQFLSLDELLPRCDFITVHTPLNSETRHLVGAKELASCKPTVRIINCARGGIVDEKAVAAALAENRMGGAAFDVYEKEPPESLPFQGDPNVICTPHLAASTAEAQERVAVDIAAQICEYLRDGVARNAINLTTLDAGAREKAAPFLSLAGKLGRLHAQLMDGNPREIVVEYRGDVPDEATGALSVAVLRGFLESHVSGPVNAVNASLVAKERGVGLREIRSAEAVDYANLVTVTVEATGGQRQISGTLFGRNIPRIVRLDGYHFDALPEGHLLFVSNDDRPGIIGLVGSTMGRSNINIAYMNVGRDHSGGRAIAILNVDSEVPEPVLKEIRDAPGILWVRTAHL